MESIGSDWYRKIWSLDIKSQSWTEDTQKQVDFIIHALDLKGDERILDLACGFGRHSLELARRGFHVTGADITRVYVEDALKQAREEKLDAEFILSDIREISFYNSYDVVINMADGAIGYLENDEENSKIFDVIAKALKPGGKHFMDIMNAGYADTRFPCQLWDAGERGLTLSKFEWDKNTRIMMYGQKDFPYGRDLYKPDITKGNPTRLYDMAEICGIMSQRNMKVVKGYGNFLGEPASDNEIQMLIYSQKQV